MCSCRSCVLYSAQSKKQLRCKLFLTICSYENIGMYILIALPKAIQSSNFLSLSTSRYPKLTVSIQMSVTSVTTISRIFLDQRVKNFEVPEKLLNCYDLQFVSNFFCGYVQYCLANHLPTATEFHWHVAG